jgi:hypothetical protein
MVCKTFYATLVLLLLTQAVSAQLPTPGLHFNEDQGKRSRTKEQQDYDKALDRDYRSATKKIPEQNKTDPWGEIRSAPSAAAKNKQK